MKDHLQVNTRTSKRVCEPNVPNERAQVRRAASAVYGGGF